MQSARRSWPRWRKRPAARCGHDARVRPDPCGCQYHTAIAICAIAFVSGTARGFSGFGSALIFMPLASSLAAPRMVAALLLIIDFVAAAPLVPNAWKQADRQATGI